ncbi:glycine betaine transporter 1 isoform X2 [Lepeophtheirus salmonis]|uniref:glycine betaine transporter 1 isoform X2 n=1 Tax=Lepeophtheirus salmonis TaxID=72036 RepID=UPI001AE9D3D3|nr:glycine betaine transporter 1-like isoform X2 [Lepeophtheirus salmonis]
MAKVLSSVVRSNSIQSNCFGASIILIWVFVIICIMVDPDKLPFDDAKTWIVANFTWLYIGSQDIWAIFAIVLYFSKYSKIKLGRDDEKPEYNDATWFMMLFACGIGTGLFFYGVAEPVYHYTSPSRYYADRAMQDNELAQNAINVTLYHWGVHGWIVYCLVGMLLGLVSYREGLPMTMKSCFYPLIGDKIFGWIGDLIDTISVLTTLFGVCTSLGLGTKQLKEGLEIVGGTGMEGYLAEVIIIWIVTAIATISTVSGVGMGIRRLSEVCFLLGVFLMVIALVQIKPMFILNLLVQSIGYYFQYIIQIGFQCDAFEQSGENGGLQDRDRLLPSVNPPEQSDVASWMDNWTMFYWGWWISWCPFVGMFIAKISRGRTLKEFINGTLTAPVLYSFLWLVIFGGNGLLLERTSAAKGYCCLDKDSSSGFFSRSEITRIINESSRWNVYIDSNQSDFLCGGETGCGSCSSSYLKLMKEKNGTYGDLIYEYQMLGDDFARASLDRRYSRLSCALKGKHVKIEKLWFDVMRSFGDIGYTFCIISLLGIVLYFVTSSDSGSLVIDCLTSNGDPDPPRIQRVFWAFMEGATATALIIASNSDKPLKMLQSAGLISGLPYTFVVCLLCVSLWRYVKMVMGDLDIRGPKFRVSLFDPFFTIPYVEWNFPRMALLFVECLMEIFMAPFTIGSTASILFEYSIPIIHQAIVLTFLSLTAIFLITGTFFTGSLALSLWFYLCFVVYLTVLRMKARDTLKIEEGNAAEDFFACLFMYPSVSLQLRYEFLQPIFPSSDKLKSNADIKQQKGVSNPSFSNTNL